MWRASILLIASLSLNAVGQPARVASLNLCTDQLLVLLADPNQVASVTWLSQDSRTSSVAKQSQSFATNTGRFSDIAHLQPDLVLINSYAAAATRQALQALKLATVEIKPAATVAEITTNIRVTAMALGQTERGNAMITQMEQDLAAIESAQAKRNTNAQPSALILQPNIITVSSGSLPSHLLIRAGFVPALQKFSVGYTNTEAIARLRPDLLILDDHRNKYPSLAEQMLDHPLVNQAAAQIKIHAADWICGTPRAIAVISQLDTARRRLTAPSPADSQ